VRLSRSIGVAVLTVIAAVVLTLTSTVSTAAQLLGTTALVMTGTFTPAPDQKNLAETAWSITDLADMTFGESVRLGVGDLADAVQTYPNQPGSAYVQRSVISIIDNRRRPVAFVLVGGPDDVSPEPDSPSFLAGTGSQKLGDTTFWFIPAPDLPAPAQLFPFIDPVTFTLHLIDAIAEAIANVVEYFGTPPPVTIPAPRTSAAASAPLPDAGPAVPRSTAPEPEAPLQRPAVGSEPASYSEPGQEEPTEPQATTEPEPDIEATPATHAATEPATDATSTNQSTSGSTSESAEEPVQSMVQRSAGESGTEAESPTTGGDTGEASPSTASARDSSTDDS
jgi:hypothetical protein